MIRIDTLITGGEDMHLLSDTILYEEVEVQEVKCQGSIKRRLLDLGIIHGAFIKPMLENTSKDMRAYLIKGTLIALRKEEASAIYVQKRG